MNYEIKPNLKKILSKISKKDSLMYGRILKKIQEVISSDPEHYKNLRHDLSEFKRVQIGSFVLVFKFVKSENKIYFEDFDHHDRIYFKRF